MFLLCYNEDIYIPYTVNYYKNKFSDIKITILDNFSNDKSFDIIICRNALHYINIDKTLSEFNRLIKNNGKILISQVIPPDDALSSEYDKLIGRNIIIQLIVKLLTI